MSDHVLRMADVYRVHGSGPTRSRLDGVSLPAGEAAAVMGPSGGGKSTPFNRRRPRPATAGVIVEIDGQSTSSLRPADSPLRRRQSVWSSRPQLHPATHRRRKHRPAP
jgi:ABC-type lipoprotein export system ATPase subunit